jgi:hypothetical protein
MKTHKVNTDALETLGTIIQDGGRDAIHLAVEPVIAGQKLNPGQDIGLIDGKAYPSGKSLKLVGIVDPFLADTVLEGEKFWLIVYPRQITSLRHVWSHPDFPQNDTKFDLSTKEKSIKWLQEYAEENDVSYEYLMDTADSHQGESWGDYIVQGGRFEGYSTPDEFWDHYSIVREKLNPKRQNFFSCSC